MKKFLFLLVAVLLFQVTSAQKQEIYQDTIPFRDDLGIIIIPITFNGKVKQFAFDTGAQYTLAYGWAKEDLKRTNKTITINSSTGLKSNMRFYKSGVVELGSRKITRHRILNTPKNTIFSCHKVDGILGVDIIDSFNWTIDYKNKILIMYPPNYFPEKVKNMHPLDFDYKKQRPYVYLKLNNNKFRFLLDTGAGGTSNISKRNYNLTGLEKYDQTTFYSGSFDVNGIFTSSQPKTFQFPEASSKRVTLSPIIDYNNEKSTKIGNTLWKNQELFLSLRNKRLFLGNSKIDEAYEAYPCTVMFSKGKMRIMRIQKDSDLWKMGARQGDEVSLYDGKKFTDFCSLDTYNRKMIKSGKSFEIQLANGKKVTISKKTSISTD